MVKKVIIFFVLCFIFIRPAFTIYDPLSVPNNKFGIHILEPAEISKAAEFANSSGGEWGYATIPIRANDRNLEKWTKFMADCRQYQIIPILRIASFPVDDHWMSPNEYDLVDFANFLNELPWPTKNRYIVVYNEPNHGFEWGGFVDPAEYARVLDRAVYIFHQTHADFFVISAGLDASSNPYNYYQTMLSAWPEVLNKVDGLSFHAYGNPAFSTYPNIYSPVNIASYRFEQNYLGLQKPIFLTEAGWHNGGWLKMAFTDIWTDANIVAITPFLLNAQEGPFVNFSFLGQDHNFKSFAQEIITLPKIKGSPKLTDTSD